MKVSQDNNPFKQLETNQEVPERVKDKVMNSIELTHMLTGFVELFTAHMGGTAINIFNPDLKTGINKIKKNSDQKNNSKSQK
jgi:hypothetical protein